MVPDIADHEGLFAVSLADFLSAKLGVVACVAAIRIREVGNYYDIISNYSSLSHVIDLLM
jgi:hypothetical protein